jgi:hypothetical protein
MLSASEKREFKNIAAALTPQATADHDSPSIKDHTIAATKAAAMSSMIFDRDLIMVRDFAI